jgi:ABC-type nitrate/sulfonate/bicarbonate transport system substrate-binding protein
MSGAATKAAAQNLTAVKVMSFPGMTNFPIFVAQHKGLFAKHGIAVELLFTVNSTMQRDGLAKGDHQIIQTASDNAVAMVELAKQDAVIVTGGDNGHNHIIVQPEIKSLADLRGTTVVVDAPNTAFAFLLYKALKNSGLNKGDYKVSSVGGTGQRLDAMTKDKANASAGIMGLPFVFLATAAGLKDMGTVVEAIGPYQSDSAVVMRDWAKANGDTLVRYIKAVVEGRRWALDPANKAEAIQLLVERLQLSPDFAARSYAIVTDPVGGIAKDAKFDMEGFKNVLKLRAEIEGQWGGKPPAPDKYVDLSYYDKALAGL